MKTFTMPEKDEYLTRYFDVMHQTTTINFSRTPMFRDSVGAHSCVVVLTSSGIVGTHSHLTVSDDPNLFARNLSEHTGPAPTILVGGWGKHKYSRLLFEILQTTLPEYGFTLSDHDVLGDSVRHTTLLYDRVVINKLSIQNKSWETNELFF